MDAPARDKQLGVRISRTLHRELKLAAVQVDRPMAEIVEMAIRTELARLDREG